MPIRKDLRHHYQGEWADISKAKREASGNKCEWCGVPNHHWIHRNPSNPSEFEIIDGESEFAVAVSDGLRLTWIVLTVAHLNHTPGDNRPDNLACLCQRCHLAYDQVQHVKTRKENARRKLIEAGQMEMKL